MPASIKLARAIMTTLAAAPFAGQAGTLDYSLYGNVLHSNNITLSTDNPVGQYELIPGLEFKYLQQGSVLQANVVGTLEYHDYPGNRFDNQTQTQLAGQANWTVLPERLDFSVEDYAGVQPIDSLASNAPDNQQQTNVLSLGPTLYVRFGDALRAQAELRYIASNASKVDDFNSSRDLAAFRLYRDLSPTSQLSANVESQQVRFDNNADINFDRNELYFRYTSKLAHFDVDALGGWSQLHYSHVPSDSSPLARMSVAWRATPRSTFTLAGAYEYSDAAQDIIQPLETTVGGGGVDISTSGGSISTGHVVINSEVYLDRRIQAIYSFTNERLTLWITPTYGKLHYLNGPTLDQTSRGGGVSLSYRLQPTLTFSAFANGERVEYSQLSRRDNTIRMGVDLSRQWSSHWTTHVSVTRQRRDSNAVQQSYRETAIIFGVVYRR